MKLLRFSDNTASPVFFDMAGRFRPSRQAYWYGGLMRMGDKAVIYSYLANWRKTNMNRKLVLITDPVIHETCWAKQIPNDWLFSTVVDELIEDEVGNALFTRPIGENLYFQHLFTSWKTLAQRPPIRPAPPIPVTYKASAEQLLAKWKVPPRYAVISPLFDAKYDRHRNLHPIWWQNAVTDVAKVIPVVIIGDRAAMHRYPVRNAPNTYNLYVDNLTPMQSLALIDKSAVYIGGETGMTLWAALMGVPVVAAYNYWHIPWSKNQQRNLEVRPISAGAPVVWSYPPSGPQPVVQHVRSIARH